MHRELPPIFRGCFGAPAGWAYGSRRRLSLGLPRCRSNCGALWIHEHAFDEPESVQLMASVRAAGLLTDDEWQEILVWLDEAAQFLIEMESAETEDELGSDEEYHESPNGC
jgi:hypothetical protein